MSPRADPRAGFMLVEVLAALVVTAALVAVVLPFAGQLIAHWQAGQAAVIASDGWMRAIARLSDDVAEALPIHDPETPGPALAFDAAPRRVDLIRPALGETAAGALERVSYRVEADASGERLVRHSRAIGRPGAPAASATIMEGAYRFRFAAVGRDGRAVEGWREQTAMPLRLDLAVSAAGGGRLAFSPLALPLAARANPAAVVPLLRQAGP